MIKRKGFTLVEMLVVVSIIATLAAILLPVLATAREAARRSSCLSNIKQLSAAAAMYRDDHDGIYVIDSHGASRGAFGQMARYRMPDGKSVGGCIFWHHSLHPYVKNFNVFNCPSNATRRPPYTGQFTGFLGYGINGAISGLPESAVSRPSDLVLFADSQFFRVRPNNGTLNPAAIHGQNSPCYAAPMNPAHGGRSNVSYADGHVKSIEPRTHFQSVQAGGWFPWNCREFHGRRENWDPTAP